MPFVVLSCVLHGAALAWLARGGLDAERADPEPPRVRFKVRLASVAAVAAELEVPAEEVLRPREVRYERHSRQEDPPSPLGGPLTDHPRADPPPRRAPDAPVPILDAAGHLARAERAVVDELTSPRRPAVAPQRDDSALQRVERTVRLEPPSPIFPASAPAVDSAASDGEARPDPLHSPPPEYPRLARLRRWEGTCILLARVGSDGRLLELTVLESSGQRVLDEAALEGVRRWRFEPARRDGSAVEAVVRVPVTFRIEGARGTGH